MEEIDTVECKVTNAGTGTGTDNSPSNSNSASAAAEANADVGTKGSIDVSTRIFVVNVPTWQSEEELKDTLERFGDVEVFTCVNGKYNNGWAFVGYTSQEAISRLKEEYQVVGV